MRATVLKNVKSSAQRDTMRAQVQAVSLAAWHLPRGVIVMS